MVVTGLGLLFGVAPTPLACAPSRGRAVVEGRLRPTGVNADAVRRRVAEAGARAGRRRHVAAEPDRHRRGPLPRPRGGTQRCRCRCWPRSASRWWRCTASPISCGCCAPPSSGPRWTGTPGRSTAAAGRLPGGVHGLAGGRDELADRRAMRGPRRQEADLLRLGLAEISRVDPQPGEDEAAARRGPAAGARRRVADRCPDRLSGGGRRRRSSRRTRPGCSASRAAPWRGRPEGRPSWGELADRLDEAATQVGDVGH